LIRKLNLGEAFAGFDETWSPRIAADVNEMQVKLAKLEGEFVWHRHEAEDELFLVVRGRLRIELREQADVVLGPGELVVVPRGVEHRPVAEQPCEVLLFEPGSTLNTGNVENARTVRQPRRV